MFKECDWLISGGGRWGLGLCVINCELIEVLDF